MFVQHLLKAREVGTRTPDSYVLGAIAPRPTEGKGEPRPHPPGTNPPLTWYVPEKQTGEILNALGYEVMTPKEVWPRPPGSTREAYFSELAAKMRYILSRPRGTDDWVRGRRLVVVSGPREGAVLTPASQEATTGAR